MINPEDFFEALVSHQIDYFTGVPDSLLKDFCAYVTKNVPKKNHIITANEGLAVALACGYHLATGKFALVYMQNSGFGNAVNPLLSLADNDVYGTPMLLLIGWRGEPSVKDEPQHVKQGAIQEEMIKALKLPYQIIDADTQNPETVIAEAVEKMKAQNTSYILLVRKGTFSKYALEEETPAYQLGREEVLEVLLEQMHQNDVIVSTTGKLSRELFELREKRNEGHQQDFLTVGSMGHASHIALGIALQKKENQVYCFDGDGAVLMHMGGLATLGNEAPKNFKHIVFNNGSHESVGGQPSAGFDINIPEIAKASGYQFAEQATKKPELDNLFKQLKDADGPALLEIRIKKGSRKDLGRPTTTPAQNKAAFMQFLSEKS